MNVELAAGRTARKAAIGFGACICLTIGVAFLTVAAWLFITSMTTTLNAAMIIGGLYCGIGLIMFGLLASQGSGKSEQDQRQQRKTETEDPEEMGPKIMDAFMSGVRAGRRART